MRGADMGCRRTTLVIVFSVCVLIGCVAAGGSGAGEPQRSAISQTQWRGMVVNLETVQRGDLEVLAKQWNANVIRVGVGLRCACQPYDSFNDACLRAHGPVDYDRLDWLLDVCKEYGLRVNIAVQFFPSYSGLGGRRSLHETSPWEDPEAIEELLELWRGIASRYAGRGDEIFGYELFVEPLTLTPEAWNEVAERIAVAIREVDPVHSVIVYSWMGRASSFASLRPVSVDNVIYSFSGYIPHEFAMYHVHSPDGLHQLPPDYPTGLWNKESLREELRPVWEFARRHSARILVSEFGAKLLTGVGSMARWLQDLLELFEGYGFDYCYFAFRDLPTWSLEHVRRWDSSTQTAFSLYQGSSDALAVFREFLDRNDTPHGDSEIRSSLGKCLFDMSHWLSPSSVSAGTLDLAWRLKGLCDVEYLEPQGLSHIAITPSITASRLAGVQLLVVGSVAWRIWDSEIDVIERFVANGGAFLFYTGCCYSLHVGVNELLARFGVRCDPTKVLSDRSTRRPGECDYFWVHSCLRLQSGDDCASGFLSSSPASLEVTPPAISVLQTAEHTWRDSTSNMSWDVGEERGPFTLIAAAEYGLGRVLVVADDSFYEPCNWRTLAPCIRWILERSGG